MTIKLAGRTMSAGRIALNYGHRMNRGGNIFISSTVEAVLSDDRITLLDKSGIVARVFR